jgi:hypothetical protein
MPRDRLLRLPGLLRGIFDKETRRKALAVVDAAMELRARLGIGNTAKSVALTPGRDCQARWAFVEELIAQSGCGSQ